jgi:hypothetical protein
MDNRLDLQIKKLLLNAFENIDFDAVLCAIDEVVVTAYKNSDWNQ